jgi:hypothetical protein
MARAGETPTPQIHSHSSGKGGQYYPPHKSTNISYGVGGQYYPPHKSTNISYGVGGQYYPPHKSTNISYGVGGQYISCGVGVSPASNIFAIDLMM